MMYGKRVTGIEPVTGAWKALILPLNYTRKKEVSLLSFRLATNSLTGNWKPGGSILHPHHQSLREIGNS